MSQEKTRRHIASEPVLLRGQVEQVLEGSSESMQSQFVKGATLSLEPAEVTKSRTDACACFLTDMTLEFNRREGMKLYAESRDEGLAKLAGEESLTHLPPGYVLTLEANKPSATGRTMAPVTSRQIMTQFRGLRKIEQLDMHVKGLNDGGIWVSQELVSQLLDRGMAARGTSFAVLSQPFVDAAEQAQKYAGNIR